MKTPQPQRRDRQPKTVSWHYKTISNRIADSGYSQTERGWMLSLGFNWTGGDATSKPLITTTDKVRPADNYRGRRISY